MGYAQVKAGIWGDAPQDAADDLIAKGDKRSLEELNQNPIIRAAINKVFRQDWGRDATEAEVAHHIGVARGDWGTGLLDTCALR